MLLDFIIAYVFTVVMETALLLVVIEFLSYDGFPRALIIRNSLIVNTITLPIVWFVFPSLIGPGLGYTTQIVSSELFAFIAEALLYWKLFPSLKLQDAAIASLICNLVSFLFGLVL